MIRLPGLRDSPGAIAAASRCTPSKRGPLLAAVVFALVGLGSGCGGPSAGEDLPPSGDMVDSGSWYVRERWPHDGTPIESEHFVVYSDAAGLGARRKTAEVAERLWAGLLHELEITPGMLRFPPGQDRIDIYAYYDYDPQDWAGRAYYGGLIMWSPDHPQRQASLVGFEPALEHELVHVIQWLLTGPHGSPVDVWFIEGLPEALAGGTTGGAVRGLDQLNDLTAEYGTVSPISFKTYSQITSPEAGERFHYPMFQLAVEYLMDEDGHGRSYGDATELMIDVAEGASFEAAFEARMGMRLGDFEVEFFDLIRGYLPRYRNPVFTPVGFALVSALVVALVGGALVIGSRRWQHAAATRNIETAGPGRASRISFYSEMILASLIVIAFFLGALFLVGSTDVLYNATLTPARIRTFWILGGYLLASAGLLLWAMHRWTHRSRAALLVAPLIMIATGATIFGIVTIL